MQRSDVTRQKKLVSQSPLQSVPALPLIKASSLLISQKSVGRTQVSMTFSSHLLIFLDFSGGLKHHESKLRDSEQPEIRSLIEAGMQ